jgi:nucleotide-binding universal stress UspA family protein
MRTTEVPFGAVIVGIDAARSSATALDWAADRAALDHRDLVLVHGTGHPTVDAVPSAGLGRPDPFEMYDDLASAGRAILHRATTRAVLRQPKLNVHQSVVRLDPGQALVDLSERVGMIVVGSRGRGHLLSLVLGSVSEDVAGRAACPVVVVRPQREEHPRHGVLAGMDSGPESVVVLETAFHEAWLRRMPLTVVHAVWDAVPVTAAGPSGETVERSPDAVRRSLAASAAPLAERYPEVQVAIELSPGVPAEFLVSAAAEQALVVVGHHQRHGFDRLLHGSVALAVLEHATTPVVIVPVGRQPGTGLR